MWSNQSDRKKICYIQEDHVNINIFINSIYDTHITFFSINELINRRGWGWQRGHDGMVFGFTPPYAFSAYLPYRCEFASRSWQL